MPDTVEAVDTSAPPATGAAANLAIAAAVKAREDTDEAGAQLDYLVELDRWGVTAGSGRCASPTRSTPTTGTPAASLAPGVERLDRRSGITVTDGLEALEAYRTVFSLDDWSVRRTAIETSGDRRILMHEVWWFRDGVVEDAEVECLTVVFIDGEGRSERLVSFDAGDLVGARAELHRGAGHVDPGIDNAVWRVMQVQRTAVNDHEPDTFFVTLDATNQYHDLRPGLRLVATGEEALDVHRTMFALDERTFRSELVATRGPHLALGAARGLVRGRCRRSLRGRDRRRVRGHGRWPDRPHHRLRRRRPRHRLRRAGRPIRGAGGPDVRPFYDAYGTIGPASAASSPSPSWRSTTSGGVRPDRPRGLRRLQPVLGVELSQEIRVCSSTS